MNFLLYPEIELIKFHFSKQLKNSIMNNLFKGLLAGYGAKKLGGGCFSTILIFVLIWFLLGQCSH